MKPNLSVDRVSKSLSEHIEQAIMSVVLELPPSDSYKILVNLESLYGICSYLLEVNALMTFPKQLNDLLMVLASSNY